MISKHFRRSEFACQCGCGSNTVDVELIEMLELVRAHFGKPIKITSGNRCVEHNKKIGGSSKSKHVESRAADFVVLGLEDQHEVADWCDSVWPTSYGIGWYDGRTHIDSRSSKARWRSS